MNALATPFRQLVERRLWPVAVLLVAAIAAVFLVLAKDQEPAPPVATAASASEQGLTQPVVAVADADKTDRARKVLGSSKNPFRPAIKAKKAKKDAGQTQTTTSPTTITPSTGTGFTGGPSVTVSPLPGVTVPTVPKPTYELYSLVVRFGESSADPAVRLLKRLKGLPGGAAPKLMYLGLLSNHKTAVFLVDADVTLQGDGRCDPTPENCQTLRMKAGDTQFVDVKQADGSVKQYQLDIVKVLTKKTKDAVAAKLARAGVAKGGRAALRARLSRVGTLKYSETTGTLKQAPPKARDSRIAEAGTAVAG